MIVLDTNVISALMRARPEPKVVAWLDAQPSESIWTTSVSVFEVHYGLNLLPEGDRRQKLQDGFEKALAHELESRVLAFDTAAAHEAAAIGARLRTAGRTVEIRDVQIAGIVSARRGTLATRNTAHFIDSAIPLTNPWDEGPG